MTPQARAQIEEHLLDAIAANHRQARLLHDPSPEVDSALEHLARVYRLTTGEAHDHAGEAIRLLLKAQESNHAENASQRAAHPLLSDQSWGVKSAARALSPVLAGPKTAENEQKLADLLDVIPPGLLMQGGQIRASLVNELRVTKSTRLYEAIIARRGSATP